MSITTNKQTLREAAEKAKELGAISRYTKAAVARLEFKEAVTPDVVLALLDELEAAERRNAELRETLLAARSYVKESAGEGSGHAFGLLQAIDRAAATDKGQ